MYTVVLAATHQRKRDAQGQDVPLPLLDLEEGEPYLTTLVAKAAALPGMRGICVVTNEALKPDLEAWRASLPPGPAPVHVVSDGTREPEERLGAIGDLRFALEAQAICDDVLVVGGDNWFAYDLGEFVKQAQGRSPAVVVSSLPNGIEASRFGLADLDDQGRIVRFVEKSPAARLPFRASCVYFLAAADLRRLQEFADANSTVCAPGVFLSWLLTRRVPVYGVRMAETWYDIAGTPSSKLRGPFTLEFRDELRRAVGPFSSPWERAVARRLQWVSSHEDLLDVLHDNDANKRLVAARLLGVTWHLLNPAGRQDVIRGLLPLLGDRACNEYDYGGPQSDEEDAPVYVSETAAAALVRLGYAANVDAVFETARAAGHTVVRH